MERFDHECGHYTVWKAGLHEFPGRGALARTIFNSTRDGGFGAFMHRAVTTQNPIPCDQVSDAGRLDVSGGEYSPYFISRFNTGDSAKGNSTFYYTLSTWNP